MKRIKRKRIVAKIKKTRCRICGELFVQPAGGRRTTCPRQPWMLPEQSCVAVALRKGKQKSHGGMAAVLRKIPGYAAIATPDEDVPPLIRERY